MYPTSTTIFAGMSPAVLQQALANAQQAYLDLSTGAKGVSFSYSQGDGTKTVTYSPAQIHNLTALIKQLQTQLGMTSAPRRPIRFRF